MARSSRLRNRTSRSWLRRIARDTRGATAIEYGLIVALIALAALASIIEVADTTTGLWNNVSTKVTKAG